MAWAFRSEQFGNSRGIRVEVELDSSAVSYAQVLSAWRDDSKFRSQFIALLRDAPFSEFRWETPPVTAATTGRPFEFVLLDSPGLVHTPSERAFAEHFVGANLQRGIAEFPNLGRDATLVVPCPAGPVSAYGHLAAFSRGAPETQQHALWAGVGDAMVRRVSAAPVWLSTAGAGVPWLHVRLDDRPKYYGYAAYRPAP
jgi:hypothetical protein